MHTRAHKRGPNIGTERKGVYEGHRMDPLLALSP